MSKTAAAPMTANRASLIAEYIEAELVAEALADGRYAELQKEAVSVFKPFNDADINWVIGYLIRINTRIDATMFYSPADVAAAWKRMKRLRKRGSRRADHMDIEDFLKEMNLGIPRKDLGL